MLQWQFLKKQAILIDPSLSYHFVRMNSPNDLSVSESLLTYTHTQCESGKDAKTLTLRTFRIIESLVLKLKAIEKGTKSEDFREVSVFDDTMLRCVFCSQDEKPLIQAQWTHPYCIGLFGMEVAAWLVFSMVLFHGNRGVLEKVETS